MIFDFYCMDTVCEIAIEYTEATVKYTNLPLLS